MRKAGAWDDRLTGKALFSVFHDRTTRPIDGIPDPHEHWHVLHMNVTLDPVEDERKATELGLAFKERSRQEALWHADINERLMDAGYGMRRTDKGLELSGWDRKEIRLFCKRTAEIEKLEERLRFDLERQAKAIVESEARQGRVVDFDSQYAKLKDQLGAKSRQGKNKALFKEGPELAAKWAAQLPPGRWESRTLEQFKTRERTLVLEPERAKELAIEHIFARRPTVRDCDLFREACRYCEGAMRVSEIEDFCASDPRFVRNPEKPGLVTTHEIKREEERIRAVVAAGKGIREPIAKDKPWEVRDKQLDDGQLAAVKLILESRDMVIAVPGRTGAGKSRTVCEAAHAIRALTDRDPFVLAPGGKQALALAKAAGGTGAHTIASFKVHQGWQKQAAGRPIFIDEFSQIGNIDTQWLLDFGVKHNSPIVFFGDGKQLQGVTRGNPVSDLIKENLIAYRQLHVIYRQKDPELLAAVTHSAEGRFQESVDKVKEQGWFQVRDNEVELRRALVLDLSERLKRDDPVMAIALTHRHGQQITNEVRSELKGAKLLGADDVAVKWLQSLDLSEAQRRDPVNYRTGQVVKFHRLAPGGFKSGQSWTVDRVEQGRVLVSRDGQQKALGLEAAKSFGVYETGSMPLAVGDLILATSNNDRANVRTGDRVHVKAIDGKCLTLEKGKKLDVTEGIHFRQGYTVTAFACQGSQEISVLPFFPASVSHMIDQRSWHVVISRAVESLRIYTNCPELVEQRAITPQNQLSALEFLNPPLSTAHTQDRELARESFELAKQIPELRLRRLARGDLMRLETASRAALEQAQSMEGGLEIER